MSEYSQDSAFQDMVTGLDDEIEHQVIDLEYHECIKAARALDQRVKNGVLYEEKTQQLIDELNATWRKMVIGRGPMGVSGSIKQVECVLPDDISYVRLNGGDRIELLHHPMYYIGFSILSPDTSKDSTTLDRPRVVSLGHIMVDGDDGDTEGVLCAATLDQIDPIVVVDNDVWVDDKNKKNPMQYRDHSVAIQEALSRGESGMDLIHRLQAIDDINVYDNDMANRYGDHTNEALAQHGLLGQDTPYSVMVDTQYSTHRHTMDQHTEHTVTGARIILHHDWEHFIQRLELHGTIINPETREYMLARIALRSIRNIKSFRRTNDDQSGK